ARLSFHVDTHGRGGFLRESDSMSRFQLLSSAAVLAVLAAPAVAQDESQNGPAVVLSVNGGGFSPLAHLDEPGLVDFKTGFNVGGGLGYQFNRYVALRGNFTFARAEGRDTSAVLSPIPGTKVTPHLTNPA